MPRLSFNEVVRRFRVQNLYVLSTSYENLDTPMLYECYSCGLRGSMTTRSLSETFRCPGRCSLPKLSSDPINGWETPFIPDRRLDVDDFLIEELPAPEATIYKNVLIISWIGAIIGLLLFFVGGLQLSITILEKSRLTFKQA